MHARMQIELGVMNVIVSKISCRINAFNSNMYTLAQVVDTDTCIYIFMYIELRRK